MAAFNIAFVATMIIFFIGRITGLMLFTRIPSEYQEGFQKIMNPFGRTGFIQVAIVLLVMALLVRQTSISPLILGGIQVAIIAIILGVRHVQVHKTMQTMQLPLKYARQFWLSRSFTLVSFLSFFSLLIVLLNQA